MTTGSSGLRVPASTSPRAVVASSLSSSWTDSSMPWAVGAYPGGQPRSRVPAGLVERHVPSASTIVTMSEECSNTALVSRARRCRSGSWLQPPGLHLRGAAPVLRQHRTVSPKVSVFPPLGLSGTRPAASQNRTHADARRLPSLESRTYSSGEVVRKCRLDLAPDTPWRCPDDCPEFPRRTMDVGWRYGSLTSTVTPPELEPTTPNDRTSPRCSTKPRRS